MSGAERSEQEGPQGNPFFFGGAIKPPYRFIGREREQREIFSRLRHLGCVSVVGERRIGKSSLLLQLQRTYRQQLPEDVIVAYLNLQDAGCHTRQGFLALAMEVILAHVHFGTTRRGEALRGLAQQARIERGLSLDDFAAGIGDICEHGSRPVLLIDEFENFIRHTAEFDDAFFDGMRALADRGDLAMLTASHVPLETLLHRERGLTSSFTNVFTRMDLGLFSEEEAYALLTQSSDHPFSYDKVRWLVELTGRHPAKLQDAAYRLYEAQSTGRPFDRSVIAREHLAAMRTAFAEPRKEPSQRRSFLFWTGWIPKLGRWARNSGDAVGQLQDWALGIIVVFLVLALIVVLVYFVVTQALDIAGIF